VSPGETNVPTDYLPETGASAIGRLLLAVSIALGAFWVAAPAEGVLSCTHDAYIEWAISGQRIRGRSAAECAPESVTYNRVRVQEKVGPSWVTRSANDWTGNSAYVTVSSHANCAGHGQDLWRSQGYFENSGGGGGTDYAPNTAGQTFNCP